MQFGNHANDHFVLGKNYCCFPRTCHPNLKDKVLELVEELETNNFKIVVVDVYGPDLLGRIFGHHTGIELLVLFILA